MEQTKTFGDNLLRVRLAKNITREQLATVVEIEPEKLILMEKKMLYPTLEVLFKFVDALNTNVGELIQGDQIFEALTKLGQMPGMADLLSGVDRLKEKFKAGRTGV